MRNTQAARYARWAAITAGLVAVIVGGVYVEREVRASHERHVAPAVVPKTVERQSGKFTYSGGEKDRTIYTISASHATVYKDSDRTLLEDVWITIYGRDGTRNDNIHTRECSYEPKSGDVRCQGDVQIDIQGANSGSGKPAEKELEIKTRDLKFNRESGEASTSESVNFSFPEGTGHGVGVRYSTSDATLLVEHAVEFDLTPSEKTSGLPVSVAGSSLEIRRNDHSVVLNGPTVVRQGGRELTADEISMSLDDDFHARQAIAEGHPAIHVMESSGKADLSADTFQASLNPQGWIEKIVADGNVSGTRETTRGTDHFSAARAELVMQPAHNALKDLTASGGVTGDSEDGADSRLLKTSALHVVFSPAQHAGDGPEKQSIESAETLGPATIESKSGDETTELRARKFTAVFGSDGRLAKLLGHSGVEVLSKTGNHAPQSTTAAELVATLGGKGDWETLEEDGNVQFQQGDRRASAAHARIERTTDTIAMDGSPVLSDAMSRSTVGSVKINQKSGEIQAGGGVVSTYIPTGKGSALNLGAGTAHISADSLAGSTTSGHVVYSGHARLWQGESVLEADQIELWREERKMQAEGHVVAVFPQTSGGSGAPIVPSVARTSAPTAIAVKARSSAPVVWEIRAPLLTYWDNLGKVHLEGGVTATSLQGSMESRVLDAFLGGGTVEPTADASRGARGQLDHAIAQGSVVVLQDDVRATAERADYTAGEGKFVLSGGEPTIVDASGDTTTGHSLTFFVSSDTILVDSQSGSHTLTKHRVEK